MLKQRLITILIALPLFLAALILLTPWQFSLFSAALVAMAAWEWAGLVPFNAPAARLVFVGVVLLGLGISAILPLQLWLWLDLGVWVWASAALVHYGRGQPGLGAQHAVVRAVLAVLTLIPFWLALNSVRAPSTWSGIFPASLPSYSVLLLVLGLVWSVDTGAYIAGRTCGRHLLMPRVSPKKTWEGLVGGVVLCASVVAVCGVVLHMRVAQTLAFVGLAVITAYFAVVGDLFESMLKRQVQVKDSSGLLPGHGGILDRFDSVIAALPMFALGMMVLRHTRLF